MPTPDEYAPAAHSAQPAEVVSADEVEYRPAAHAPAQVAAPAPEL